MKKHTLLTLFILILIVSNPLDSFGQRGERYFSQGISQFEKENYFKAGDKFFKAFSRGYFPAFEALSYAALAYYIEDANEMAIICIAEAEWRASEFTLYYKNKYEQISDSIYSEMVLSGEALYDEIYTLADTSELWSSYSLKESVDLMVYTRAGLYFDESKPDSAIMYANIGLKRNKDPDLLIIKGDAYMELSEPDSALLAYRKVMLQNPEDIDALTGMGEAFQLKEENELAMEYFEMALEIDSSDIWSLYCKAALLYESYNYEEALEIYNKLISLSPDYYFCYYDRGIIYFDQDKFDLAIDDFEKYLEFDPSDADALYNLSAAQENLLNGF